jgi:hypothetical protein
MSKLGPYGKKLLVGLSGRVPRLRYGRRCCARPNSRCARRRHLRRLTDGIPTEGLEMPTVLSRSAD